MEKSFGIGCFHFGLKGETPFNFVGNQYIDAISTALNNIPNITEVHVEIQEDIDAFDQILDEIPRLNEGKEYFPCFTDLEISFRIYIPFRIQAELMGFEERFLDTYTENFKIVIQDGWYLPIAFIETLDPTEQNSPSTAVIIIRKFLENSINQQPGIIYFEILGPTPFHFDGYILPSEEEMDEQFIKSETILLEGFDKVHLTYDTTVFANSDEVVDYIFPKILEEFGLAYHFVQERVIKMHNWSEIEQLTEKLNRFQFENIANRYYYNTFDRPKLLANLTIKLIDFSSFEIISKNEIQKDYKSIYSRADCLFKRIVDLQLTDDYIYPISQVERLLDFHEKRRLKSSELIIVFISAVFGGAMGALLTNLFK